MVPPILSSPEMASKKLGLASVPGFLWFLSLHVAALKPSGQGKELALNTLQS